MLKYDIYDSPANYTCYIICAIIYHRARWLEYRPRPKHSIALYTRQQQLGDNPITLTDGETHVREVRRIIAVKTFCCYSRFFLFAKINLH